MKILQLAITTKCNLNCNYCIMKREIHKFPDTIDISFFSKENMEEAHKYDEVFITGGEPTIHPNFIDILYRIFVYTKPSAKIYLYTNGLSITHNSPIMKAIQSYCNGVNLGYHKDSTNLQHILSIAKELPSPRIYAIQGTLISLSCKDVPLRLLELNYCPDNKNVDRKLFNSRGIK